MCAVRRRANIRITGDKCVHPAELFSAGLSSPSITRYFSANSTNIAKSPLKLAKLANFAGNASMTFQCLSCCCNHDFDFRFKKCLEAGMKPSWVLSDEERNRRFNKFNKLNGKNVKSANTDTTVSKKGSNFVRVPEIYITFTLEEQKMIEYIKSKFDFCRQSWLRNLMMIGKNYLEPSLEMHHL